MPKTEHFAYTDGVHNIDFYVRQFRDDRLAKNYSPGGTAIAVIEKYYDDFFTLVFEVANDKLSSMAGKWNGRVTIATGENTTHVTLEGVSRRRNLIEVCGGSPLSWRVIRNYRGLQNFVSSRDANDVPAFGDKLSARIPD